MKRFSKRLMLCIIASFIIFGLIINVPVHASTDSAFNTVINFMTGLVDGIIGIMTWLYRLPITAVIVAVLGIMSTIAGIFGYVTPTGDWDPNGGVAFGANNIGFLGPDDIFFNKLLLTDANVFKIDKAMPDAIIQIRESVALWYYIMRVIAIAVLLGILIYIAIRMSISTIASEKASYKKMLVNWASSIGLVFLLHYLIVGIAFINSTLIEILYTVYQNVGNGAGGGMDDAIGDLLVRCLDVSFIVGATSLVVVVLLIVQTFAFLVYYIKRMLTISFLIIISPLITITYSIDKLGDGKAQALNTWMKEYFFTVIIQPFHCIIYMVFVSMSMSLLSNTGVTAGANGFANMFGSGAENLIAGLLSIFCIKFIWDAEKIFKNIFGIKVSETLGDAVMSAAVAGTMVSKGMNMASKAKSGAKTLKYSFSNGKMGELTGKVKEGKFGKMLKIDTESKDRKFAEKMGMNYDEMKHNHNTEGIKQIHEKRLEAEKIRKENGLPNKIRNSRVVKGVKKFGESEIAQTYKRYIPTATGVAAAIIGGSAMYGSSAKTSLFEAGMAGYGSYKGMKSMADRIMYAKKENYTDNVEKSQATMAQIKGIENTGDKEDAARMHLDATRKEKQGELSNTEIGNKEKEARKKIRAMLRERDHMDKGDKNPEIDQIMSDIQNGIFLNDLDMDEIAKKYKLESADPTKNAGDDLREATGEFAEAKLYKQMAQDNQDLDDLMGQDGFYKIALQAWAGNAAYQLAENGTGGGEDTSTNTADTFEEQEEIYTEEITETHNMMNEVNDVTHERKEDRLDHIIEEQIKANEAMKNGELSPEKLKDEFDNAKGEITDLVRAVAEPTFTDPSGTKYYDESKINSESNQIMKEVYKGVDNGKIDIAGIANKHGLKPEDLRAALEVYLEKMLMRQMVDSSERLDKVGGEEDMYKSVFASMMVKENMSNPTSGNEQEWNKKSSDVMKMMAEYADEKRKGTPISPSLDPTARAKKEKQDELLRQIEYLIRMMPKTNGQTQIKEAVKPVTVNQIQEITLNNGEKVDYSEIERIIKSEMAKAKTNGRQITTVEIFETIAKNHKLTGSADLKPEDQVDLSAMAMQIQRELLNKRVNEVLK